MQKEKISTHRKKKHIFLKLFRDFFSNFYLFLRTRKMSMRYVYEWLWMGPLDVDILCRLVQEYAYEFEGRFVGAVFKGKGVRAMLALERDLIAVEVRGMVRIVNIKTKQCVRTFEADFYRMVANGASIVTCSVGPRGALLRSWDWATGECTLERPVQHVTLGRTCFELQVLPNNRLAVFNYFEVRVCDFTTLKELYIIRRPGVQSVLGLPDWSLIVCVEHTLFKYNGVMMVREGTRQSQSVAVHQLLHLGDDFLASCGTDHMISLWDTETLCFVRCLQAGVSPGMALLPDGRLAFICTMNPRCVNLMHHNQTFGFLRLTGPTLMRRLFALHDGRLVTEHDNDDVCLWA